MTTRLQLRTTLLIVAVALATLVTLAAVLGLRADILTARQPSASVAVAALDVLPNPRVRFDIGGDLVEPNPRVRFGIGSDLVEPNPRVRF